MPILERPDTTLYYESLGSGPPVLFLQGIGVIGRAWEPQTQVLHKDFHTLVADNRGIGRSQPCVGPIRIESMADDCEALLDKMGWESAHVVGHSMGGATAIALAMKTPKRVRSLSLLCTFHSGKAAMLPSLRVIWLQMRIHLGTKRMRRNAFLDMLFAKEELAKVDRQALIDHITPLIGRDLCSTPPIMFKQLNALSSYSAYRRLGELSKIPTLVVSAERDPIALPRFGEKLAAAIPGSEFVLVPRASHGVVLTQADEINSRLRRHFLAAEKR